MKTRALVFDPIAYCSMCIYNSSHLANEYSTQLVVLASFGNASLKVGLSKLVGKFQQIGFKISSEEIAKLAKHYKEALPISY